MHYNPPYHFSLVIVCNPHACTVSNAISLRSFWSFWPLCLHCYNMTTCSVHADISMPMTVLSLQTCVWFHDNILASCLFCLIVRADIFMLVIMLLLQACAWFHGSILSSCLFCLRQVCVQCKCFCELPCLVIACFMGPYSVVFFSGHGWVSLLCTCIPVVLCRAQIIKLSIILTSTLAFVLFFCTLAFVLYFYLSHVGNCHIAKFYLCTLDESPFSQTVVCFVAVKEHPFL